MNRKLIAGHWVQGAPQWLIDRMEALRKRPPSTLERARRQLQASAEQCSKREVKEVIDSKGRKVVR